MLLYCFHVLQAVFVDSRVGPRFVRTCILKLGISKLLFFQKGRRGVGIAQEKRLDFFPCQARVRISVLTLPIFSDNLCSCAQKKNRGKQCNDAWIRIYSALIGSRSKVLGQKTTQVDVSDKLFLMGLFRPLFPYLCLFYSIQLTYKFLPMLGFEPQIGSVGSHCSVNCATECLVLQIVVYGLITPYKSVRQIQYNSRPV